MPEPIRYETKSERELLIVVAQAINSLNEKTTELCEKVKEHEQLLSENKDRISIHELKLVGIMASNSDIAKTTTTTLKEMHAILDKQVDRETKIEESLRDRKKFGDDNRKMIIALWSLLITAITALAYFVWNHVSRGM
jgi:predicted ATP-dependent protease